MDSPIDLRSDTVSKPSDAMRRAMAAAEVGDDCYGDDPTVNRLQDLAAGLAGQEAAVYLPTGTLCNQIAMHAFVRAGHAVVCEATAHVRRIEAASAAVLSGIAFRPVRAAARGLLTAGQVATALAADPSGATVVDLVTVENTHQLGGGFKRHSLGTAFREIQLRGRKHRQSKSSQLGHMRRQFVQRH